MDKIVFILLVSFFHSQVFCHKEDESIIIHSIKKRNTAEQLGPIPFRQREEPPQPIVDAVLGHTAVLNPNLQEDDEHDPQSSIAGGVGSSAYADRTPLYRQYIPERTQGDEQAPTYDYRQSGGSYTHVQGSERRSHGSESGSQADRMASGAQSDTQSSGSQTDPRYADSQTGHRSTGSQTDPRYSSRTAGSQTDPRRAGSQTGHRSTGSQTDPRRTGSQTGHRSTGTQTDPRNSGSQTGHRSIGSQTDPRRTGSQTGHRSTGTQTDPRRTGSQTGYRSTGPTDPRYSSRGTDTRYAGQGYTPSGATATYSPTGVRRLGSTQPNTGQTGPTGRRRPIAAIQPLGPIVSYTGQQPTGTQQGSTRQVYRQTPGYRNTYNSVRQPTYSSSGQPIYTAGQPTYNAGQPTYTGGQPTYTGGQPTYTGGQPTYTGGQPRYTGRRQYTYPSGGYQTAYQGSNQYGTGQQPYYTGGTGQTYVPYGFTPQGGGGTFPYNPSQGPCPETGIRMRINGMDCARAVDFYGSFLCYRHESTSRECCEKCQPLKNPSKVGCEYGDHSYQCRQIQAHDCYDLRNRQSCCETCDRLLVAGADSGCEYGDMTPRCQRVQENPSLCYIPENQRLCCSTCSRLSRSEEGQVCPWGDQNANLCRPFDQYGGVRINCYAEPIRRLCCQTCERLKSRMPPGMPAGCDYGDRPVIFNTGEFGSLNCTSFFRHFPVEQCQLNQAVSVNCCFTCHRYTSGGRARRREGVEDPGRG